MQLLVGFPLMAQVCVCVCVRARGVRACVTFTGFVVVLRLNCFQGARPTGKKEQGSRARGHALLKQERPNCVTILSLGEFGG